MSLLVFFITNDPLQLKGLRFYNSECVYLVRKCQYFSFSCSHCPISTANTHIGSSCADSGGQVGFGLILVNVVNVSANQKQFRSTTPNQSHHCFALSSLWWRSGYTFYQWPSSPNYSPAFIELICTMWYIDDAKGWLYFWEVLSCFTLYKRKVMTYKRVLRPMKPESCVLAGIWLL